MKLLAKNNRLFFRFTALLLFAGMALLYPAISWIIRSDLDEKLQENQRRIEQLISQGTSLPQFPPTLEVRVVGNEVSPGSVYSDTLIFNRMEGEDEPYRQLLSHSEIRGKIYEIVNRSSVVESEDLMLTILGCMVGLILLLFIGLIWFNHRSAQRLWMPFKQQLNSLKKFSLVQNEPLELAPSDISEFEELRVALQQLTEKVRIDYRSLKTFTENASHEFQTPLAIMRSKIETLIEKERVSEQRMKELEAIYEAVNRLSRLNKGLLLLTKIENRQFSETSEICVHSIILEQVELLKELTEAKKMYIRVGFTSELTLIANRDLIDIMIKNLLENAIKYSKPGDSILLDVSQSKMKFCNPGAAPLQNPEQLFQRFQKQGQHPSSLGLGLAIVKEICSVCGWQSGYEFKDGFHCFFVDFNSYS